MARLISLIKAWKNPKRGWGPSGMTTSSKALRTNLTLWIWINLRLSLSSLTSMRIRLSLSNLMRSRWSFKAQRERGEIKRLIRARLSKRGTVLRERRRISIRRRVLILMRFDRAGKMGDLQLNRLFIKLFQRSLIKTLNCLKYQTFPISLLIANIPFLIPKSCRPQSWTSCAPP